MKKTLTILIAVIITATLWAQSPEKMSYQAVVRNANNNLVTNTNIGIQVSILQNSATGTPVYVEKHSTTTNDNGLVTLEIGTGTVISGDFSSIDWANDIYFVKTEIDLNGGANYTISSTNQLLSVPYALHAKTADSIIGGINETDPAFTNWDKDYADLINKPNIVDTVSAVIDSTTQFVRKSSHWIKNGNNLHYSNGLVGIGVAIPIASLDIYDNVGNPFLKFVSEDNVYTQWISDRANVDDYLIGIDGGNNRFTFANITTGNYPLVLQNDNVGIGILNPTEKLHVVGNIQMEGQIKNVTDPTDAQDAATKAYVDNKASTKYQVGDFAQGGIVFWVDETGEHGLVCAKSNQDGGSGVRWYAGTNGVTRATGDGPFSGELNTLIIISSQVSIGDNGEDYAAQICNDLQITEGGKTYGDWYLPSKEELNLMYQNKTIIDATATANGGSAFFCPHGLWSSTEDTNNNAWRNGFNGAEYSTTKDFQAEIRAIRSF